MKKIFLISLKWKNRRLLENFLFQI